MNIIKPKKLVKGDTIGIVAVSGAIKDIAAIERAKSYLEYTGYKVVLSDTVYKSHRYMAGTDQERAKVLNDFFSNENIDAIFCARGGYGALRILDMIDYNIIKTNPKIFVGYSDITALLAMIFKKTGLITFHGAMMSGDFGKEQKSEYTENAFFKTLSGNMTEIKAEHHRFFNGGTSKGILWGGNLSTLVSIPPLDFVPNENIILFLEDLNEPVYKIDKMLTQLLNIPNLRSNLKGIALGEFSDNGNEDWLNKLLTEIAEDIKVPVCNGFKISHGYDKETLPFGYPVNFNSNIGVLRVENSYME